MLRGRSASTRSTRSWNETESNRWVQKRPICANNLSSGAIILLCCCVWELHA